MAQHATARRTAAPIHPRRYSGPARRPLSAVALPAPTLFERLLSLPDNRFVDRLLRGRLCIWVIGIMLGGIVAMQVSLLKLNSGISRAVQAQDTLVRENADLETQVASLTDYDRVHAAAVKDNMIDPQAGDTKYLAARPGVDDALAVRRMRPPSLQAKAVMANHGRLPGTATDAGVSPVAGGATQAGVAGATQAGVAATATPVPTATPVATATPLATATPVPTVAPVQAAPGTAASGQG